jgi:hypothetical protein
VEYNVPPNERGRLIAQVDKMVGRIVKNKPKKLSPTEVREGIRLVVNNDVPPKRKIAKYRRPNPSPGDVA